MRPQPVVRTLAAALAGACAIFSGALSPTLAQRQPATPAFDPLFADNATCAGRLPGAPRLLTQLVQAQTETAPFLPGRQPADRSAGASPPLYADLGSLHVPVTTSSRQAQAYFDQGMRLTFAFNHAEAARAFRAAQRLDPRCAMCHWGEALVLGPNINAPMLPAAQAPALAAVRRAQLNARRARAEERALIAAVAKRYSASADAPRAALDQAYADAMTAAARAFPANDTIQVLHAEALMDLSPWNYWEAGGMRARGRTTELVGALERVLARTPTHPGAAHYYIHAMEASAAPHKALPASRVLAAQMPGAGHLVHMPSHIYYRVGLYKEALQSNLDAIAADERYFARADSDPVYKGAYYPHNIHFVMVSALMGGDGNTALEAAAKLDRAISPELLRQLAVMQPVKAAPYFSHVQFSSADVLVALPDPGPEFALVKAMWHYARAVGFARKGDSAASRGEITALSALERQGDFKSIADWGVPARDIVRTALAVASGRLADAQGNTAGAIAAYQQAVALQDALPYTEPPYWYYPVRQSLGAAQLRANQLDAAEQTFRASLSRTPSNGWALRGLMEVYRQRGDGTALAAAQQRFATTWLGRAGGPPLSLL